MNQKLLIVCHGNICRSPVTYYLIKQVIPDIEIRQGGFYHKMNRRSPKKIRDYAAQFLKLNLENHRSRAVTKEDVAWADKILYMDNGNLRRLQESFPKHAKKFEPLGAWSSRTPVNTIADPNYLGGSEFYWAMLHLTECSLALITDLITGVEV